MTKVGGNALVIAGVLQGYAEYMETHRSCNNCDGRIDLNFGTWFTEIITEKVNIFRDAVINNSP